MEIFTWWLFSIATTLFVWRKKGKFDLRNKIIFCLKKNEEKLSGVD